MTAHQAKGAFDATRTAEPPYDAKDGVSLGRSRVAKRFHGALDATSTVEMLAVGTPVVGSAGYVALERVEGTLDGRAGSFVLQHSATMTRGAPTMSVTVVPDSGTGELVGLVGRMAIDIVDGKHAYTFDYEITTPTG